MTSARLLDNPANGVAQLDATSKLKSTQIPTLTASNISGFSISAAAAAPVQSVAGRTGDIVLTTSDISGYATSLVNSVADLKATWRIISSL
jgi:hypothetical protein